MIRKKELELKDLGIETVFSFEDIPSIPSSLFPSHDTNSAVVENLEFNSTTAERVLSIIT